MLRESLSDNRPKGSGNFNGPSGLSMCHRSFSRVITRKKAYVIMIADSYGIGAWWGYEKNKGMLKGERQINWQLLIESQIVRR